jgi:hypothetical protein
MTKTDSPSGWEDLIHVTSEPSTTKRFLQHGDDVAILPTSQSPATEVLEIATVRFVGGVYIQLTDGRMYATIGGKSLGSKDTGYIVPATDAHRAALKPKAAVELDPK